ncbi:hypothetical protein SAMN05444008_10563 [Cnuella takakiae]|uniref:Uncharacterized protein n=1 Tax=Cnuella takakiae TaxID=1302690 RepID=A0A1M4Z2D5_9BACT|nr:hypothetical protein [Cnuella takakiae]OLY94353.1 hypothetical protein BUE76_22545 [Cnuella takakiae]SHF12170.1 hypothetical protein SAMN05444008_10563 [Cnuella takakiae]
MCYLVRFGFIRYVPTRNYLPLRFIYLKKLGDQNGVVIEKVQAPILIPQEPEQSWQRIRNNIKEELVTQASSKPLESGPEQLLASMELAKMFRVSLVTSNSRVKGGHNQRGEVFFLQSEVLHYIKTKAACNW